MLQDWRVKCWFLWVGSCKKQSDDGQMSLSTWFSSVKKQAFVKHPWYSTIELNQSNNIKTTYLVTDGIWILVGICHVATIQNYTAITPYICYFQLLHSPSEKLAAEMRQWHLWMTNCSSDLRWWLLFFWESKPFWNASNEHLMTASWTLHELRGLIISWGDWHSVVKEFTHLTLPPKQNWKYTSCFFSQTNFSTTL